VALQKFLKSQEKNLKTLILRHCSFDLLDDLKDLHLDHIVYRHHRSQDNALGFLRHQVDLKVLRLDVELFDQDFNVICELKNLENLELNRRVRDPSGLGNLHNLKKLKRLKVGSWGARNVLDYLQLRVFNDLEELDANIWGASLESVQEMKRITPNLKKIDTIVDSSDKINALLETLENLESMRIRGRHWEISKKYYPKMKHLEVSLEYYSHFNAKPIPKVFPNLEYLRISSCQVDITEALFIELLSGLKRLKTFKLRIQSEADLKLNSDSAFQCFQQHGKHLADVQIDLLNSSSSGFRILRKPGSSFCVSKI
jgi:hypothetical protein